jgi:hypothetical protein
MCNNYNTFVFGNNCNTNEECSLLCYADFYQSTEPLDNICSTQTTEYTNRPILPCCCHPDITSTQSTINVCPSQISNDPDFTNNILVGQFFWDIDRDINGIATLGSHFDTINKNRLNDFCDLRCYGYKYNFIYFLPFYAKCCN